MITIREIMKSLKTLASKILKLEESNWTDLKLANGITASSGGLGGYRGVQYKKVGNHVYIRGSVSFTYTGNANIQLTEQLPVSIRPKLSVYNFVPLTRI